MSLPQPSGAVIAGHYDSLDPFYRDLWGEHVHHGFWLTGRESPAEATALLSRRLLAALELKPGARLADVGCGYGGTARLAAEEYGAEVTGYTLSAVQKRHADGHAVSRGSVTVQVRDWMGEGASEGPFDALLSLESLEHIGDKAAFARKARQAVLPGGRVVIATWLRAERVSSWAERHLLGPICREGRLPALATIPALGAELRLAGFAEVATQDLTAQVSRTWGIIIRRLAGRLCTRRDYWGFLMNSRAEDRVFALTACRIWLAYRLGCFRYGYFVCR